jgi:hypothetical protein
MVFDPTYPKINHNSFKAEEDWMNFYGYIKEIIPPNAPQTRGKAVVLRCFVDSDHTGDQLTRRSRPGCIHMINMAPISWYSKKPGIIEGATFCRKSVAHKGAIESSRAL